MFYLYIKGSSLWRASSVSSGPFVLKRDKTERFLGVNICVFFLKQPDAEWLMRLSSGSQLCTLLKCPWVKCCIPKQLRERCAATFDLWPLSEETGGCLCGEKHNHTSEKHKHFLSFTARPCATCVSCRHVKQRYGESWKQSELDYISCLHPLQPHDGNCSSKLYCMIIPKIINKSYTTNIFSSGFEDHVSWLVCFCGKQTKI